MVDDRFGSRRGAVGTAIRLAIADLADASFVRAFLSLFAHLAPPGVLFRKYHQMIPASFAAITALLLVAVTPLRLLLASCLKAESIRNFFA
jgi:hypothetical protein